MANKYEQIAEVEIDLHGYTTYEAEEVLYSLLREREGRVPKDGTRHNSGQLHVRLIVGKGIHSENGPVLPDFVRNYLRTHGVRYAQSKIMHGGEGALEVFFD